MFSYWVLGSVVSSSLWPHGLQHARLPCLSHLPEFAQTHFQWVSDAILQSHSSFAPCLLVFNLSKNQNLFQWVSFLHQVAKVCIYIYIYFFLWEVKCFKSKTWWWLDEFLNILHHWNVYFKMLNFMICESISKCC